MICGSSSRGVTTRATTPAAIETRMNTIDRFDSRNFRTIRMVRESCSWLMGLPDNDRFPRGEAAEYFKLAADGAAQLHGPPLDSSILDHVHHRQLAGADQRRRGHGQYLFRLHGNQQAPAHPWTRARPLTPGGAPHKGPAR